MWVKTLAKMIADKAVKAAPKARGYLDDAADEVIDLGDDAVRVAKDAPKDARRFGNFLKTVAATSGAGAGIGAGAGEIGAYNEPGDYDFDIDRLFRNYSIGAGLGAGAGVGLSAARPVLGALPLKNPKTYAGLAAVAPPSYLAFKRFTGGDEPAGESENPWAQGDLLGQGTAPTMSPFEKQLYGIIEGDRSGTGSSGYDDLFDLMNNPKIAKAVERDIASMQSPLRRQVQSRKEMGGKQIESLSGAQDEYRRAIGNIQGDVRGARREFLVGQREAATEAEDAMNRVADRLLGSSITSDSSRQERGQQVLGAAGRERASMEQARELGDLGTSTSSDLMAEMAAAQEMQSSRDIRDAQEATNRSVRDIEAEIADVAARSPALQLEYAKMLGDYQNQQREAEEDQRKMAMKALFDLNVQREAGGGSASDFLSGYRKYENPMDKVMSSSGEEMNVYLSDALAGTPHMRAALAAGGPAGGEALIQKVRDTITNPEFTKWAKENNLIAEGAKDPTVATVLEALYGPVGGK